jgi:hypothetical protein
VSGRAPIALAALAVCGSWAAEAHGSPPAPTPADANAASSSPWSFEPRAFLGGVFPLGEPRRLFGQAGELGLGVALGRLNGRIRARVLVGLEPALGVGGGASITIARASFGAERVWRRRLVTALDVGAVLRRISVGDEISHDVAGTFGAAEIGWRFAPSRRCSLTASARYSFTGFREDAFAWHELGARITVGWASAASP